MKKKIYLAAPLFNEMELKRNEEMKSPFPFNIFYLNLFNFFNLFRFFNKGPHNYNYLTHNT